MFQHLDENADAKLSVQELYDLEHDKGEGCLKAYLQQCDLDKDLVITSMEWCKCFAKADRPCEARRRIMLSSLFGMLLSSF